MKTRLNPWLVTIATLVLGLTAVLTKPMAQAGGNPNPGVLPSQSRPYGLRYTQWAARWSQWIFSIPSDQSPLGDPDGRFCQVGQSGPVFFLGSNFGGTSVRSCTVPAGKSLLFTPAGFIGLLTVDADTEEGLRAAVQDGVDAITNIAADVDGVPIKDVDRYRVLSPLSSFTLPADNVFGLASGDYQYILEGFFFLLAPPAVGDHVIHLHDEFPVGISDVTYNITVAPRGAD